MVHYYIKLCDVNLIYSNKVVFKNYPNAKIIQIFPKINKKKKIFSRFTHTEGTGNITLLH